MDLTLTRRALLGAFGAATAVGVLGVPTLTARGADIFDELRLRYRASLVGPDDLDLSDPVIAKEAAELGKEMDELVPLLDRSADRRGVFTDLNIFDDPDASRVTDTYKRLLPMATAWAVPGHHWSASTELADHLVEAMRWMNENVYTAGRPEYENWWDWELGSVSRIGKILVIAYDIIPEDLREAYADAVDWYVTPGYMYPRDSEKHKPATGSNLLNICLGPRSWRSWLGERTGWSPCRPKRRRGSASPTAAAGTACIRTARSSSTATSPTWAPTASASCPRSPTSSPSPAGRRGRSSPRG